MKSALLLGLLLLALSAAQAEEYTYEVKPVYLLHRDQSLLLNCRVRVKGQPHAEVALLLSGESVPRNFIEAQIANGDLPYSYFRLRTNKEIPEGNLGLSQPMLPIGGNPGPMPMGVVIPPPAELVQALSKEAPLPITNSSSSRRPHIQLTDANILDFTEITQHEFLNVKPRIVDAAGDAK